MKKINKPSITCFDDAKHLMLEKYGRNYSEYCCIRNNPSRNVLEFWNGFLSAMEICGAMTPEETEIVWNEISTTVTK